MKYLMLLFLPVLSFAQPRTISQDSITYEKIAGVWYKINHVQQGTRKVVVTDEYTTIDSLVFNTLKNEVNEAAYQYQLWKEKVMEEEKSYLLRIRQAEKVYKDLTGKRVDLDTISNAKQLIGTWLYDGEELTITKQLKIKTLTVNFVSEKVFWINIDDQREYFFKKGNDWISEKHKLVQVKKVKK